MPFSGEVATTLTLSLTIVAIFLTARTVLGPIAGMYLVGVNFLGYGKEGSISALFFNSTKIALKTNKFVARHGFLPFIEMSR